MEQLMYRPAEAAQALGIGRTRVFCADQVRPRFWTRTGM